MRAISPDMPRAALACQDPGRPHVPHAVENGRNTSIMSPATYQRTSSPVGLVPAQRPPCQAWCVSHDHAEGICQGPDAPTPGGQWSDPGRITVSHGPVGGTLYTLTHDPDAELTAAELLQLVQAALDQIALALGVTR